MKKIALVAVSCVFLNISLFSQYADLGSGNLKNQIWWFDWNGFVFTDGATRTFTTVDGLTVTFTFSNFTTPSPVPSVMNTWPGAVLHLLYDFSNPNIKPAIYSLAGLTTNTQFDVSITATRGGLPTPFTLVAADAEACVVEEPIVLQTSGSVWQTIDFFRNSSQTTDPLAGCGTQTATISDTYAGAPQLGQNPVIATQAPASGQITINVGLNRTIEGLSAIAFGLFSPVDRGDLPPSYLYAQHKLNYTYNDPCNYLPPLPSLTQSQNLKIGLVPGDADGTESADDNAIGVDEDGVGTFPPYDHSSAYSVTVNLANTTGNVAFLSGWLDFNRDGVFQDNEKVVNTIPDNATSSVLTWTGLPTTLPPGSVSKWAFRFRLSSDLNAVQSPSGFAPDGEVEDYLTNTLQPVSETSGVINDYTEVLAFDPCKNILTVTNATAYNVGDTVLLIEMKGAMIDSSNSSAFGNITDYKNAGNYEYNYVKSKTGNQIELKNALLRQYDIPYGKVQLVRVPYYQDAVVTSTLTCLPWDGSKGGVLVFNVANSLQLDADIDVSNKGFRGGAYVLENSDCGEVQYYYDISSTKAALKGEGVFVLDNNKAKGRGKDANGGGGGNDHNAGGGGGGNYGAGGIGGKEFVGIQGCTQQNNGGVGGTSLNYTPAQNKIFMGGGGGAGDVNDMYGGSKGGNGGGLVIINTASLMGNSRNILSKGEDVIDCQTGNCWNGYGGGGAGGTVLISVSNYLSPIVVNTSGGKGGNLTNTDPQGYNGPGGGGSGGVLWVNGATIPAGVSHISLGGTKGIFVATNNDGGSQNGDPGGTVLALSLPFTSNPFQRNIDSVRMKDSATSCSAFDFKGFAYTNSNPIVNWQWIFGDGNTANTQNISHNYTNSGTFIVKLIATDVNGCKDSISSNVTAISFNSDFDYKLNACSPLTVQFNATGSSTQNSYWSFGDVTTTTGISNPVHTYPAEGNYTVKYGISNGQCSDTATKTINLSIIPDDIILTHDTTICLGLGKQLLTKPALSFCWNPVTYLDNPNSANPVTSTPQNITYYYTAEIEGNNLITNGNFSLGTTGFTSAYTFDNNNMTEGEYFVGFNPQTWNSAFSNCSDHTTGSGNMMLVNGSPIPDAIVWTETVNVTANTNYAFSTWIQSLIQTNPATLQFSINGKSIGNLITASTPACTWTQFYTTWNSGNNTSAVISIVNKNTIAAGNDFALDDISFSPVLIKRDSVRITVDTAAIQAAGDATVCPGVPVQLNTTGAVIYLWTPSAGLTNSAIANPVATPSATTQYIVTGTNNYGCVAKDTVTVTISPIPAITKSNDNTICKNTSIQLFASGGTDYSWTPAATLSDPNIANPFASPTGNTTYYVTVTDAATTCSNSDSIKISIRPDPVFSITTPNPACENVPVQLSASGGDIYSWQPASFLSNSSVSNPVATPPVTTDYSVQITETTCNNSTTLTTTVNVKPLPTLQVSKSNDLDCNTGQSQLTATGASQYNWSPAASLNNTNIANPIATPVVPTLYIVKGTTNGCDNYDSIKVDVVAIGKSEYYMPNAFTPNGDGNNDCYGIRLWGVIQELEFSIYNRWGQRIFYTKNPNDCWDGTFKGVKQDIGVYVYMVKAKTLCGSTFRKGFFTLIR